MCKPSPAWGIGLSTRAAIEGYPVLRLRAQAGVPDRLHRRQPGRQITLELLPAVWLFGDKDDYLGQRLETEPMFQLDAHLTPCHDKRPGLSSG